MDSWLQILMLIILLLLVFLSAIFSAAETAYTSVSLVKIEAHATKGSRTAKLIEKHYKSFGWVLATIILSNNLVNVALSSLSTYLISDLLGSSATTSLIATVAVTPILVIFGELFPKIIAKKYPYRYLSIVARVINFLNYLFWPFTYPLSKLTLQSKITNTENDIRSLLTIARKERVIEDNEATLATRALDLDSKIVYSIMTKKRNIISVPVGSKIKALKKQFISSGHSRILVKEKNKFIGVVIIKDILLAEDDESILSYIIKIPVVSKGMLVTNALEKMRVENSQIALVQTTLESSSTLGIITVEDIIEELVGEIYDEHDSIEKVRMVAHHKYIAYGSAPMSDLEKEINFKFPGSKNMTVKKWMQSRITRKIRKNLRYEYKDKINFRVLKNNNKQETIIEITIKF